MGRTCEQLPPSEVLPDIGLNCVVYHNGKGFYYICREYSSSLYDRVFECVGPDCVVTANMGPGIDSPLIDNGNHSHSADLTYRDKCILLHTIRQRFLYESTPAASVLQDVLATLSMDENCANEEYEAVHTEDQSHFDIVTEDPFVEMEVESTMDENWGRDSTSNFSNTVKKEEDSGAVVVLKPNVKLKPITSIVEIQTQRHQKSPGEKKPKQSSQGEEEPAAYVLQISQGDQRKPSQPRGSAKKLSQGQPGQKAMTQAEDNIEEQPEIYEEDYQIQWSVDDDESFNIKTEELTDHDLVFESPADVVEPRNIRLHRRRTITDKQGYMYCVNKVVGDTTYLRCSRYLHGCYARAVLRKGGQVEEQEQCTHNHRPDPKRVAIREFTAAIIAEVENELKKDIYRPFIELYKDLVARYPEQARYVNYTTARRSVRRAKLLYQ